MRRLMLLLLFACNVPRADKDAIAAADMLTRHYANQELEATVAGTDCTILVIEGRMPLDDVAVESIHYGTGEYGVQGGVEQFANERFRAVVYRDPSGVVRTYGSISHDETQSMPRCR